MAERLVVLAPIGGLIFTLAWLVLGGVSPGYELFGTRVEPYSWISQPVSGLGLGVTAAWMNTAFVVGGILLTAGVLSTAASWWSRGPTGHWAVVLLSLMGVGMVVCGVFTLESMMLHLTGFLLAIPVPAIGLLLAGVSLRGDSLGLAAVGFVGGALALILFAVFMAVFDASGAGSNEGIAGLIQRALIVVTMTSVVILTVALPRHEGVVA
ncbi:DUF998 domain-containing protein [Propionibacteriaceae bacterium G57]|uniref:DUF998 domain-containing protein n=1 Tax=Aestuariimicrobium sp. G57 TaxID=3418485 RepID=UPI003DA6F8EB